MCLFQLCALVTLALGHSQGNGGGWSCSTAMPRMAELAPQHRISGTRAFAIVRRVVYKFPSGSGPWCPSLSRGHSLTLKANSKQPQLGINPMGLCKPRAQLGVGVCQLAVPSCSSNTQEVSLVLP